MIKPKVIIQDDRVIFDNIKDLELLLGSSYVKGRRDCIEKIKDVLSLVEVGNIDLEKFELQRIGRQMIKDNMGEID